MSFAGDRIALATDGATASLALLRAELMSWRVGGRELIWQGDPAHWPRRAPILFPVIGESAGGHIRVAGVAYPMPRHGFVRDARFTPVERGGDGTRLRLLASQATFEHYPFRFQLDVVARLRPSRLTIAFEVANTSARDMPYALGFHPAFPWPLDGGKREGHAIEFESEERPEIPDITDAGLLRPGARRLPFEGRKLPLDPELFEADALVLLDARSRSLRFAAPSEAVLDFAVENLPHFALWTKPAAPFLSIEAWTAHADPEGFAGDLFERPFMRRLAPGAVARHQVTLSWSPGA